MNDKTKRVAAVCSLQAAGNALLQTTLKIKNPKSHFQKSSSPKSFRLGQNPKSEIRVSCRKRSLQAIPKLRTTRKRT
jgi:hypothetical protein